MKDVNGKCKEKVISEVGMNQIRIDCCENEMIGLEEDEETNNIILEDLTKSLVASKYVEFILICGLL